MNVILWMAKFLEFLGGSQDQAPSELPRVSPVLFWGVWWGLLSIVIYVFCGQSSKFIYIDF